MKIILGQSHAASAPASTWPSTASTRVLKLKGPPVYVYHEIVHNKHVVQDFVGRGA